MPQIPGGIKKTPRPCVLLTSFLKSVYLVSVKMSIGNFPFCCGCEMEETDDPDRVYPKLDDAPATPALRKSLAKLSEFIKNELGVRVKIIRNMRIKRKHRFDLRTEGSNCPSWFKSLSVLLIIVYIIYGILSRIAQRRLNREAAVLLTPQAAQESSSAATHRITIIFSVCIRKENI